MNVRIAKLYAWLFCLFAANIIVYTVVTLSKRPGGDRKNKGTEQDTFVTLKGKLWRRDDLASLALWQLLTLYVDRLGNPILRNTTQMFNLSFPESCAEPFVITTSKVHDFTSYPDHMKDFVLSMHCRNYSLVIDAPDVCHQTPDLLLAIKSQVGHFNQRQAIRDTWGSSGKVGNLTIKTVFLLGKQDPEGGHPNLSPLLDFERRRKGDILMWGFHDTFFNLTLKDILFFQWLEDGHCPSAKYIFKGDEDVYVSSDNLAAYISGLNSSAKQNLFVGNVIHNATPIRDPKLKYFIPESFYKGSYPPYAGGGGLLFTRDMASRLYSATQDILLFPIDDVYLGMCLKAIGVDPQIHPGFMTFDFPEKDKGNLCIYRDVIMVHRRTPQETIKLWHEVNDPALDC
ncbi:N-acetyllactosaminide beta-1,3-N-acetylglucosaminyltransferase 2-like [Ambystoma mexicanum]|uniref:N-acetyllactosaminide beta-1,3-N-acetylglucosaminyltransferase 2-like n=1 Tax=Ambystoma mexicanum TaxID=8296 RepID=UPI0037E73F79